MLFLTAVFIGATGKRKSIANAAQTAGLDIPLLVSNNHDAENFNHSF